MGSPNYSISRPAPLLLLLALTQLALPPAFGQRWVDGSTHPEAIPDTTAYLFLFQSLLPGRHEPADGYASRIKAYTVNRMKLGGAVNGSPLTEAELVLAAARQYQGILGQGIPRGTSAPPDPAAIGPEFDRRVGRLIAGLEAALPPPARQKLAAYLEQIKRQSRIGTGAGVEGYAIVTAEDDGYVYATAVALAATPTATLRAGITLENPRATARVSADSGDAPPAGGVTASVRIPKGLADGEYRAAAQVTMTAGRDPSAGWAGEMRAEQLVAPWAQLVRTSVADPSMAERGGRNTFRAEVRTSEHCAGTFQIYSGMTRDAGIQVEIERAPGQWHNTASLAAVQVEGGATVRVPYAIRTAADNAATGIVTVSASFHSWPGSCNTLDPDPALGHTLTQTIDVSN